MKKPGKKLKKTKVLFISGSPRNGNTDFILQKLFDATLADKSYILLRNKKINHCKGCLACHVAPKCSINDDMAEINRSLIESDLLVIGTPNYFDNVSGLLKDFIDRTHPLYKSELLKDKQVIFVMIGGGEPEGTKVELSNALAGFVKYQKLQVLGNFAFQSLKIGKIKETSNIEKYLSDIADLISINI